MHPELIFTVPPDCVQAARVAMARAECRLALQLEPLTPNCDATLIALAFLNLEAVHPPYPPLFDVEPSHDPRVDVTEAIRHLGTAIAQARTVADIVRYAATIVDLDDLDLLADDPGPGNRGGTGLWP